MKLIEQYGADGVRMGMMLSAPAGNDILFDESLCEQGRNFNNKIWNAFRLVQGWQTDDSLATPEANKQAVAWFTAKMKEVNAIMDDQFKTYRISEALMTVYRLFWDEFSSWYLEMVKPEYGKPIDTATYQATLHFFDDLLKMLHPFMPFITDEVYRYIPGTEGTIMLSDWPKVDDAMNFPQEAHEMEGVMDVIRAVRNLRAEMNVSVGRRAHLIVRPKAGWEHAMAGAGEYFGRLAWASGMQLLAQDEEAPAKTVSAVSEAAELFIPLGDLVDVAKETARLTKERDSVQRDIERGEAKLNNPGFTGKAPAQLVEQEREKLAVARDKLAKLNARIEDLANM